MLFVDMSCEKYSVVAFLSHFHRVQSIRLQNQIQQETTDESSKKTSVLWNMEKEEDIDRYM